MTNKLRKIIVQGNNRGILALHRDIFEAHRAEFREDNLPTAIDFVLENTLASFGISKADARFYHGVCRATIDRYFKELQSEAE